MVSSVLLGMPLWIPTLVLPVISAAAAGAIWRAKGGDVADGIALGGILNVLGVLVVLLRKPRRSAVDL